VELKETTVNLKLNLSQKIEDNSLKYMTRHNQLVENVFGLIYKSYTVVLYETYT